MMDCNMMMGGHAAMMWGMGFAAILVLLVLLLGAAALIKYLFFSRRAAFPEPVQHWQATGRSASAP